MAGGLPSVRGSSASREGPRTVAPLHSGLAAVRLECATGPLQPHATCAARTAAVIQAFIECHDAHLRP